MEIFFEILYTLYRFWCQLQAKKMKPAFVAKQHSNQRTMNIFKLCFPPKYFTKSNEQRTFWNVLVHVLIPSKIERAAFIWNISKGHFPACSKIRGKVAEKFNLISNPLFHAGGVGRDAWSEISKLYTVPNVLQAKWSLIHNATNTKYCAKHSKTAEKNVDTTRLQGTSRRCNT